MRDLFDLSGKTVIVTGGSGLIGTEVCTTLEEFGAEVVVAENDEEKGRRVADELGNRGLYHHLDITNEDSVAALVDCVDTDHEGIDGLVNCAYPRTADYGEEFENVNLDAWNRNIALHLGGYYATCRHAARVMVRRNCGGSIVNLASIYGVQAPDFAVYEGTDMTSPVEYSGIKGGVINLTRYLASYLGSYGIRANAVSPGGVFDEQEPKFVERYENRTPLGRMADPGDIAPAVLYLISDAAAYVTGHNLVIDGGWTVK